MTRGTTFVFISMLKSHSLTLTISHSLTLSMAHSRHGEQLLFSCLGSKVTVYSRKLQCFFFDSLLLLSSTLSCYFRVHRAGSQLKMSERQTKAGNLEHSLTHSFTISRHAEHLDILFFLPFLSVFVPFQ